MYKDTKKMLNLSEIIEHLKSKGVKFNLISEEDAKKYLRNNNNFFKLSSYRKNYNKFTENNTEKYINLDFKYLMDSSIIDMILRKTMLSIVLDLEHYTKVKLISKVETNYNDGYTIVEDYINYLKSKDDFEALEKELLKSENSVYSRDLVRKYRNEYPIWVFIEIIPFGRLIHFYMFVAKKINDRSMINEAYLLKNVRELRNACAHNNCILNDLKSETAWNPPNYNIMKELGEKGISKKTRYKKMTNPRIQQIVTMLYLNKNMVTSEGVLNNQKKLLQELKSRIEHHMDYYDNNNLVQTSLQFFIKIIDIWYKSDI